MEKDSFIQKDVQKIPLCSFNVLITVLTHLKNMFVWILKFLSRRFLHIFSKLLKLAASASPLIVLPALVCLCFALTACKLLCFIVTSQTSPTVFIFILPVWGDLLWGSLSRLYQLAKSCGCLVLCMGFHICLLVQTHTGGKWHLWCLASFQHF